MMAPKAICLVGRENWGKSETLFHLVGGSRHIAKIEVAGTAVFVRHMSNDDIPESFIQFVHALQAARKPVVVIALCPNFTDPSAATEELLRELASKGYTLHFWVLRRRYGSSQVVAPEEIRRLERHGAVEVYDGSDEASIRAENFRDFITRVFAG
jgi:hypothetical protein